MNRIPFITEEDGALGFFAFQHMTDFGRPVLPDPRVLVYTPPAKEFLREVMALWYEVEGGGFDSYQERLDNGDCDP